MDAQGSQTNAKEDTRYLGDGGGGQLELDQSQYATDLNPDPLGSGGAYELASARAAIAYPREIYVRVWPEGAEAGLTFIGHHADDLSNHTFRIGTNGSGAFVLTQNNTTLWTGPVDSGSDVSISWSTRANPDSTGAGDALISEVVIYNHTTDAIDALDVFTHAVPTTNSGWTFSVGGVWVGGSMLGTGANWPIAARLGASYHPHVEVFQDWVAERASHTTSLVTPREPIGASLAAVGGQGEWAGQANVGFIGAHANALRGRMLSPLVNEVYSQARTIAPTFAPAQWHANAPSSAAKMDVTKLRWLPVPGVEYAFVRVHVTSWVTTGSAVPVAVRCYSMTKPPLGPDPGGSFTYTFAEASLTANHGSGGMGEWLEFGLVKLSTMAEPIPGWTGTTTLCLAYAFDPDGVSTNDANARLRINAWQVRPALGEP